MKRSGWHWCHQRTAEPPKFPQDMNNKHVLALNSIQFSAGCKTGLGDYLMLVKQMLMV